MAMTLSYNSWPASSDPGAIGVKAFSVAGHAFPGGVKAGDVATVFTYVVSQFHLRVENLGIPGPADEWGYTYRVNRNADNLSCHSSGTAVDVNASRHPNGKRRTFSPTQVATLRVILNEAGGVIRWGGDFATPDEMHLEVHGTPAQVHVVAVRLLKPAWFHRTLTVGSVGDDVKRVQRRLGFTGKAVDGKYGPDTAGAVKRFEQRLLLPVTSRVDARRAYLIG